jgi:predicted NAD/FAD-dependent oxidoreductase
MQVDDPHESCVELLLLSATELPHGAQATLAGLSFVSCTTLLMTYPWLLLYRWRLLQVTRYFC